MNQEDSLKAVDGAFDDAVKHLYDIFAIGLETGQVPLAELTTHFRHGLAVHCDAHAKTTAIVTDYFKGFK